MADIAVLGDERSILGFKPFGVDVYFYEKELGSIDEWFKGVVRKDYKLILVIETIAEKLKEQIDALWFKELPVVLTIRGVGESSKASFERLRRLVIKAVGTDLFQEN
jgi:vacuolar-type H+-ATPase subunit F/Vma7